LVEVRVLLQSYQSTTFEVKLPQLETLTVVEGVDTFVRMMMPGAHTAALDSGRPEVPEIKVLLAIPACDSCAVHVDSAAYTTAQVPQVYPLQPDCLADSEPPSFVFDTAFYAQHVDYPAQCWGGDTAGTWRDLEILPLRVFLATVNPGDSYVMVAEYFRFTVTYSGGAYPTSVADWMQPLYAAFVANYQATGIGIDAGAYRPGARLLAICDSSYRRSDSLAKLLAWVEQRGYEVKDTFADWSGEDAWRQVRLACSTEYFSHTPPILRWVLLVGDAMPLQIPLSELWTHEGDFSYSCITRERRNHSVDFFPDFGIARLSPRSIPSLDSIIGKILHYETGLSSDDSWVDRLTLVGTKDTMWKDATHEDTFMPARVMRDIQRMQHYNYWDPAGKDTIIGSSGGDNGDVAAALNQGTGILLYAGHGLSTCWAHWCAGNPNDWTVNDVYTLTNDERPAVVLHAACDCGAIQKENECLAEAWLRKCPGGAVATTGATGTTTWPNVGLCSAYIRAICDTTEIDTLGGKYVPPCIDLAGMKMYADAYMFKNWGDLGPIKYTVRRTLVLGEPSMPVWVGGVPTSSEVSAVPDSIPLNDSAQIDLYVTIDSEPVGNALACVSGGGVYAVGRTDAEGHVRLDVYPMYDARLTLTLSEGHADHYELGANHTPMLPFVDTIVAGHPPRWTERSHVLDAPSGKKVKEGGWLTYDASSGRIFVTKGNNTPDFYIYCLAEDLWLQVSSWPDSVGWKKPKYGSAGCCDGQGHIFATKGNNTLGFWEYYADGDSWQQKPPVPLGPYHRKVKYGADIVWAMDSGVGHPYILKGYKNEFYRYDVSGDSWHKLTDAPGVYTKWHRGSWLAYDGDSTIYAHKGKYHEFYAYNIRSNLWSPALQAMPVQSDTTARKRKLKDGGSGVFLNGFIYAFKGGGTQEFWRYDTAGNAWTELDTIPQTGYDRRRMVKAGGDLVVGPGNALYALKGNKSNQFWRYVPGSSGGFDMGHASSGGREAGRDIGETPVMEGVEALSPRWRSDGTAIVVSAEDSLGWLNLWKIGYSGGLGTITRLTDVQMDCEQPVFNPAGTQVAFTLDDTATGFYQIAVVSAGDDGFDDGESDARDVRVSVSGVSAPQASSPGLASPSQKAVTHGVASATSAGNGLATARRIADVAPAFGEITALTSDENDHYDPSWSPDGGYIVYTKDGDDGRSHIWRIPSGGGEEQQLTSGSNCEEVEPSYLNADEIVFTLIPDGGHDQIAKAYVGSSTVTYLTTSETDHEGADPAANGSCVAFQALDDDCNSQIAKVSASGGQETFLTTGSKDMEEPDWSPDNHSLFCVRWDGIPSAICRVDADNGGWTPVTDSSAIRDNPDAWFDVNGNTSYIVYEREAWNSTSLLGGGGGNGKRGTGIFRSHYRRPHDGEMGAGLGVLALDRIEPNPTAGKVKLSWQIPVASKVSLKVYNTAGQLVSVLAQGEVKPGRYSATWARSDRKGRRLAAGIYFCTLDNGEKRVSRKVVLTE